MPILPSAGPFSVAELAQKIPGAEIRGEKNTLIYGLAAPNQAGIGDLIFLVQPKYRTEVLQSRASAVLLTAGEAAELFEQDTSKTLILCANPLAAYALIAQRFYVQKPCPAGIHPTAVIAPTARISESAVIGPQVFIDDDAEIGAGVYIGPSSVIGKAVQIGADSYLHPHSTVYADCSIGKRAIIHSGAVIGADGFGMVEISISTEKSWCKIPQIGRVLIGDDVEIGANTTIDRGALEDTIIGNGVKLDNQIQIGHNCQIGEHTAIAGCVGIAGSARIGRYCKIGGAAMILGHLEIADDVTISAGTLINKSIRQPGVYTGSHPFMEYSIWRKNMVHLRHLDRYVERLNALYQQSE